MSQQAGTENSERSKSRSRTDGGRRDPVIEEAPGSAHGSTCSRFYQCFRRMNGKIPCTVHIPPCLRHFPCVCFGKDEDAGGTVPMTMSQPKYARPNTRRQLISGSPTLAGHHKTSYLRLPPLDEDEEHYEWTCPRKRYGSKCKVAPEPDRSVISLPNIASKMDANQYSIRRESPDFSGPPSTAEEDYVDPYVLMSLQNYYTNCQATLRLPSPPRASSDINIGQEFAEVRKICRPHLTAKKSEGPLKSRHPNLQRMSQAPIVPAIDEVGPSGSRHGVNPKALLSNIRVCDMKCKTEVMAEGSKKVLSPDLSPFRPDQTENEAGDDCGNLQKLKREPKNKLKSPKALLRESNSILSKWGKVTALFIPTSDHIVTRSGYSFPTKIERAVDFEGIELKHLKVLMSKGRLLEKKQSEIRVRRKYWDLRRQIGLYKRGLMADQTVPAVTITGELEGRFQHVYSFSQSKDSRNQVARYYDLHDERLVTIKSFGHENTANIYGKLRDKLSGLSEINSLKRLDHGNVVQIQGYFELDGRIHLLLEACEYSMRSEIKKSPKGIRPNTVQGIMNQVLNGLSFCHRLGCLHTNISPENLLMNSDGALKLTDFDKAVFLHNGERRPFLAAGSIAYGAPELLARQNNYGFPADVWSVGCVFAELLRGFPLWNCTTEEEQLVNITKSVMASGQGAPRPRLFNFGPARTVREMMPAYSEDILSFVTTCLDIEPQRRSTCKELLLHPYLTRKRDEVETPTRYQSMTEAILPSRRLITRPHSAPPPLEYDSNPCVDLSDYNLGIFEADCRSAITSTDCVHLRSFPDAATLVGEPPKTRKKDKHSCPGSKAGSKQKGRRIRLKKVTRGMGSKPKAVVVRSDLTAGSISSHGLPNNEGPGTDRSRKALRPKGNVRRQSACDPANSTEPVTDISICDASSGNSGSVGKRLVGTGMLSMASVTAYQIHALQRYPAQRVLRGIPHVTPRGVMKTVIDAIKDVDCMESCEIMCLNLTRLARKTPKAFAANINPLVTALLHQIAIPKSKVAAPPIKLLQTICEVIPHALEQETERVIDVLMAKVGGPVFIDTSCCQVMNEMIARVAPARLCTHLAKIGLKHRLGIGRAMIAKFLCDGVRRLDINTEIGDATTSKLRFTSLIFEAAVWFSRDTHVPTRDYARELFVLLIQHIEFWRLYIEIVPAEARERVNKVLDEIRMVKWSQIPRGHQ